MRNLAMLAAAAGLMTGLAPAAPAAEDDGGPKEATLCVYDPGGARGDVYQNLKDYKTAAVEWGVRFELKPYTNEKTAASDFKAGECDVAAVTSTRIRSLHPFAGTIEAMGALPTYEHLKTVIGTLAREKADALNEHGDYEIAGMMPGGAIYLFVDDRDIDTASKLAGKSVATLAYDKAAKVMVREVGASMKAADVGSFAGMFNNGSVDACYSPAAGYEALELYKGIGDEGGVIRYPLAQMVMQLIHRKDAFDEEFSQKSRKWAAEHFDDALEVVKQAEEAIEDDHWVDIPDEDKKNYDKMFRDVRQSLADDGVFDEKMLQLMKRVRCQKDPTRAECAGD